MAAARLHKTPPTLLLHTPRFIGLLRPYTIVHILRHMHWHPTTKLATRNIKEAFSNNGHSAPARYATCIMSIASYTRETRHWLWRVRLSPLSARNLMPGFESLRESQNESRDGNSRDVTCDLFFSWFSLFHSQDHQRLLRRPLLNWGLMVRCLLAGDNIYLLVNRPKEGKRSGWSQDFVYMYVKKYSAQHQWLLVLHKIPLGVWQCRHLSPPDPVRHCWFRPLILFVDIIFRRWSAESLWFGVVNWHNKVRVGLYGGCLIILVSGE